ncbi:MAG: glycosyltransferase [Pseudomonadota bacterium]
MNDNLRFFVFSYNRGQFLANCVHSIERSAPGAPIVVFDDCSSDPATCAVLEDIAIRHRVVRAGETTRHKLGGLYGNMQAALESAADNEFVCFTQDDTQMVRALSDEDYRTIAACFAARPELGFLSPAFIRGISRRGRRRIDFGYDARLQLFCPRPSRRSAGVHYSDICLSRADRLRAAGWRFRIGEPANSAQAAMHFGPMGYLRCPFLMWLPNGPAYRGKTKTLALRWAERRRRCGFHPFRDLDPAVVERLRHAPAPLLPVAEDFLTIADGELDKPWVYDPLQGASLLKHLNRGELFLKRCLAGGKR